MTNYFFARDHQKGIVWVRPSECATLRLRRPVVFCNGVFDLLHASHMRLLHHARQKARKGTLVVAMDSDRRVAELKGVDRPIMTWAERAAALSHFPIDYLVEFDSEEEFAEIVDAVDPELRVTGSGKLVDPGWFPDEGLRTMIVPERGIHTSEIVRRCRETITGV